MIKKLAITNDYRLDRAEDIKNLFTLIVKNRIAKIKKCPHFYGQKMRNSEMKYYKYSF